MAGNDKDLKVEGSRSYESSASPHFRGTKAPKHLWARKLPNTCFACFSAAIGEGRMIRDRSLLTSPTLDFRVFCRFLNPVLKVR